MKFLMLQAGFVLASLSISSGPNPSAPSKTVEKDDASSLREVKTISVEHVHISAEKSYEAVTKTFLEQLGKLDSTEFRQSLAKKDAEATRAKLERMKGSSGFMLFEAQEHGKLLHLVGQDKQAVQYVIGNPLFAVEMTRFDLRASLYAPLRVLIYSSEGKTHIEFDRPSSLFGQFHSAKIDRISKGLDQKLEDLISASIR
jgi:uncharacterized protein (DUF302 family)